MKSSNQDVLLYQKSQCTLIYVLLLLHHTVIHLLTLQNNASLSYVFSCTFLFLGKFMISWFYISLGHFYIEPQGIYTMCPQYVSIAT